MWFYPPSLIGNDTRAADTLASVTSLGQGYSSAELAPVMQVKPKSRAPTQK